MALSIRLPVKDTWKETAWLLGQLAALMLLQYFLYYDWLPPPARSFGLFFSHSASFQSADTHRKSNNSPSRAGAGPPGHFGGTSLPINQR